MPRYRVTVSTIVSYTLVIEADSEEEAEDITLTRAKDWANEYHSGPGSVDVNDEWQYEDPDIQEVG